MIQELFLNGGGVCVCVWGGGSNCGHLDEDGWLDLLQLQALVEKVIFFLNAKEGI